jgi:hypothetical protein
MKSQTSALADPLGATDLVAITPEEEGSRSSTQISSSRQSPLRRMITKSMSQFRKRKHVTSHASDGEDSHPPSKRDKASRKTSTVNSVKNSSTVLVPELSQSLQDELQAPPTRIERVVGNIKDLLRKDSKVSADEDKEEFVPFVVSERMEQRVKDLAERRMEIARRCGNPTFNPKGIINLALDWMSNLTHQDHYLEEICGCGESSNFRETDQWASYNVQRAEEEVRQWVEEQLKQQKLLQDNMLFSQAHGNLHQADRAALSSLRQRVFHKGELSSNEKRHGKQEKVNEPWKSTYLLVHHTSRTNGAVSGRRMNGTSVSFRRSVDAEHIHHQRSKQPQPSLAIGGFEDHRKAQGTHFPSFLEPSSSVDTRPAHSRNDRRKLVAYRDAPPKPLQNDNSARISSPSRHALQSISHQASANMLPVPTLPPRSQILSRTLYNTPRHAPGTHKGPLYYQPHGPPRTYNLAIQERQREEGDSSMTYPSLASSLQSHTAFQNNPIRKGDVIASTDHVDGARRSEKYDGSTAPVKRSERVDRYRASIADEIEEYITFGGIRAAE